MTAMSKKKGVALAICNRKGGVGKSTSGASIAGAMVEMGFSVLLIDNDPQGDLSKNFLDQIPEETVTSTYFKRKLPIVSIRKNLDLIPANKSLTVVETSMDSAEDRKVLMKALTSVKDKYDIIIIDCPPSLGWLTMNALTACDYLIVPMQTDFKSLDALSNMAEACYQAATPTRINGIFFTSYDPRTKLAKNIEKTVRDKYGMTVFNTAIRRCVKVAECQAEHKDVIAYDPSCNATKDYRSLTEEIVAMVEKQDSIKTT